MANRLKESAFRCRPYSVAVRFLAVLIVAAIAAACSSQPELIEEESAVADEQTAPIATNLSPEPLLERPPLIIDSLPPVPDIDLSEFEGILDRARLHIVFAQKALEKGDTLKAIEEVEIASQKLDKASYYPNIEDSPEFIELSKQIVLVYQQSAHVIPESTLDVSISALQYLIDDAVEHTEEMDLSKITFKPPPMTTVPLPLNEEVEKNILFYSTKGKKFFGRWLERSGKYFPLMAPILEEEGVPPELIYLTMIESGVNPTARSWAKCVGLWQFLKSTGEAYGLRGDYYCDDRRDPEKATRAAARHLRDLYNRYNDWHLALAAYNAGAGRIDRCIRKAANGEPVGNSNSELNTRVSALTDGKIDYWDIRPYLPEETQNYVPRYIAATIIALNPEAYDFTELEYDQPFDSKKVYVNKSYLDESLAECVGIPVDLFREMNPHLLQNITPPDRGKFEIYIPRYRAQTFASNIGSLPEARSAGSGVHNVRKGETLSGIARKYGVSLADLKDANDIGKTRKLKKGEVLVIPGRAMANDNTSSKIAQDNLSSTSNPEKYDDPTLRTRGREQVALVVREGMTLGSIADQYNVKVHDLLTWNSMKANDVLIPGKKLMVWVRPSDLENTGKQDIRNTEMEQPALAVVKALDTQEIVRPAASESVSSGIRHTVKRGETLEKISKDYGIPVESLKAWNDLKSDKLRTGATIEIRKGMPPKQEKIKTAPATQTMKQSFALQTKPKSDGTELVHEVKEGETLWSIAARYDCELHALRTRNELKGDAIQLGQKLVIPGTSVSDHLQAKKDPPGVHTVQRGENLWTIASNAGIHIDSLREWNKLRKSNVHAGQVLVLRNPGAAQSLIARNEADTEKTSAQSYVVKPGDNLNRIAGKLGLSVDDLKKANNLSSDIVVTGQVLKSVAADIGKKKADESLARTLEAGKKLTEQVYIVSEGDTLYSISKKLGVNLADLQKWNDVGRFLRTGQKLVYYAQ